MSFNPRDSEPKLLVSDSLKDLLHEEHIEEVQQMFISVGLVFDPRELSITGNLVGIEFSDHEFSDQIKVDIKLTIKEAFDFIGNVVSNVHHNKKSSALLLLLGEDAVNVPGPFKVSSVKIIELDSTNKLCVLGIDLTKDTQ